MVGRYTLKRKNLHGYKNLEGGALFKTVEFKAVEGASIKANETLRRSIDVLNRRRRQVSSIEGSVKRAKEIQTSLGRIGEVERSGRITGELRVARATANKLRAEIQKIEGYVNEPVGLEEPANPTDFQREQAREQRSIQREEESIQAEKALQETEAKQRVTEHIQIEQKRGIFPEANKLKTPLKSSPEIVKKQMQKLQQQAIQEAKAHAQSKMNALAAERVASEAQSGQKAINQGQIQLQAETYNRVIELVGQVSNIVQTTLSGIRKKTPEVLSNLQRSTVETQSAARDVTITEGSINTVLTTLQSESYAELGNADMLRAEASGVQVENANTKTKIQKILNQISAIQKVVGGGLGKIETIGTGLIEIQRKMNDINTGLSQQLENIHIFGENPPDAKDSVKRQIAIESVRLEEIQTTFGVANTKFEGDKKALDGYVNELSKLRDPKLDNPVTAAVTEMNTNAANTAAAKAKISVEPTLPGKAGLDAATANAASSKKALDVLLNTIEKMKNKAGAALFERTAVEDAVALKNVRSLKGFYQTSMKKIQEAKKSLDTSTPAKPSIAALKEISSESSSAKTEADEIKKKLDGIDLSKIGSDAAAEFSRETAGKDNGMRKAAIEALAAKRVEEETARNLATQEAALADAQAKKIEPPSDADITALKNSADAAKARVEATKQAIKELMAANLNEMADKTKHLNKLEELNQELSDANRDVEKIKSEAESMRERMKELQESRDKLDEGGDRTGEKAKAKELAEKLENLVKDLAKLKEEIAAEKEKLDNYTKESFGERFRKALEEKLKAEEKLKELEEAKRRGEEVKEEDIKKAEEELEERKKELEKEKEKLKEEETKLKDEGRLMDELRDFLKNVTSQLQFNFTAPILAAIGGLGLLPSILGFTGLIPQKGPKIKDPNEDSIGCADATSLINTMRASIQSRATAAGLALAKKLNPRYQAPIGSPDVSLDSGNSEDLSGNSEDLSGNSEDLSGNTQSTPEDIQKEEISLEEEELSLQEGGDLSGSSENEIAADNTATDNTATDNTAENDAVADNTSENDAVADNTATDNTAENDAVADNIAENDQGVSPGYFSKTDQEIVPMPQGSQNPSESNLNLGKPVNFQRSYSYQQGFNRCWKQMFNSIWQPAFVNGYNSLKYTTIDASVPFVPGSEDLSGTTTLGTYSEDEEVEPTTTQVDEDGNIIYPDTGSVVPDFPDEDMDPEALQKDELEQDSSANAEEVPPL